MADLRLEYLPLAQLVPAPRNPKRHQIEQLGGSIGRFGYVDPIILDERTGRIVAGHGRRETLIQMRTTGQSPPTGVRESDGEWLVPVVRGWTSKSDKDAEAYLLASNRHVELGGWDDSELVALLKEIELTGTGFTPDDLTALLDSPAVPTPLSGDPDEIPPEPDATNVYVRPGDLYRLGQHVILCGDATRPADMLRVLGGQLADLCWTDPPWNVAYGSSNHPSYRRRQIANDDLGDKFPGFCAAFAANIKLATKPGAALYMAMSAQQWPVIDNALRAAGFHWPATIIWAKDSLVLGRGDYHRQYEPIWYGWNANAARTHPLEDRKQSDLWAIDRPRRSEDHPTCKPVEVVARALRNSSTHGGLIFEPFSGSGTTVVGSTNGKCLCGNARCESPRKHPIGRVAKRGHRDATASLAIACGWWTQVPAANVGIATEPSGLVVVDIDPRHVGNESLQNLEHGGAHGCLPPGAGSFGLIAPDHRHPEPRRVHV